MIAPTQLISCIGMTSWSLAMEDLKNRQPPPSPMLSPSQRLPPSRISSPGTNSSTRRRPVTPLTLLPAVQNRPDSPLLSSPSSPPRQQPNYYLTRQGSYGRDTPRLQRRPESPYLGSPYPTRQQDQLMMLPDSSFFPLVPLVPNSPLQRSNSPYLSSPNSQQLRSPSPFLLPGTPMVQPKRPLTPNFPSARRPPIPYSTTPPSLRHPEPTPTSSAMGRRTPRPSPGNSLIGRSPIVARRAYREDLPALRFTNPSPVDNGGFVYFIVLLHGMAIFAPWTMFCTVHENYFLRHKMSVGYVNATLTPFAELKKWQATFAIKMALVALGCHCAFTFLNCLVQVGKKRLSVCVTVSVMVTIICYLVNTFATITETGDAFYFFVYLSLSMMAIISAALGVYQSSIWGIYSHLPLHYCNAVLIGNNLIGIVASLFIIIVTAFNGDAKITTAFFYLCGTILMLTAVGTYFVLTIKDFFRFYIRHLGDSDINGIDCSGLTIWMENWSSFLDIFVTYLATYAVYPNLAMWVNLQNFTDLTDERLKSQIFCFLTFGVFAVLGNVVASFVQKPTQNFLWLFTYSRLLFVPLFMTFGYMKPERALRFHSALIPSGWFFWFSLMALAGTHGYASSLAMLYPTRVNTKAAMMSNIFLVSGIAVGLALSMLINKILFFQVAVPQ